jgi:periplasmic divalent cation tolerance protein
MLARCGWDAVTGPGDALLVLTTCGTSASANALAELLVGRHLAACVNAVGGVESTYRWQGQVEHATETLLVIKTTAARYAEVEAAIRQQSGYELPEVLAIPIARGLDGYLDWIRSATMRADTG